MDSNFKMSDYIVFLLSLCVPMSISLYVGCFKNKEKTAKEYLYGNKKQYLNAWNVGLSLCSGTISSVSMLATVSEVYTFGTQFMIIGLGAISSILIVWYLILPVFCGNLDLKTPYEYFEYRFDRTIRILMSIMGLLHSILFMTVILYVSTISFSHSTNIPLLICTTAVGLLCTIYTLIGGFVGVIWADVIQAGLMFFSCLFVMIKGVLMSDGISNVLSISEEGQRLQFFNFDPNPFVRLSFWSAFIGSAFLQTAFSGCSAAALQRFMAVNDEKAARMIVSISTFGYAIIILLSGITGLSIYAFYKDCDPISNKQISSSSELLPLFILDIAGYIPGLVGFFSGGLISAGLSSISADMNALSGLIYYDFLQKVFNTKRWKITDTVTMKIIVFLYGSVLLILVPIVAKSKHINQVALSLSSIPYGAIVATTILGTSFPKVNAKGTFWGIITSLVLVTWITYKQLNLDLSSEYVLPVSVQNCTNLYHNITDVVEVTTTNTTDRFIMNENEPFILYKLSFQYYIVFGSLVTIFVAIIVSYITGFNDVNKMDPNLIIPSLRHQKKAVNQDEIMEIDDKL